MKAVGIIPSRMNSTRFPGKALAELCGTPMVLRVWNAAVKSGVLEKVFIATDSPEIASVCNANQVPVLMTSGQHENPTSRTAEAAAMADADYYVMLGGDEPLLHPDDIRWIVTEGIRQIEAKTAFVVNAMADIPSPEEAGDSSNIKIICTADGRGISAFRHPEDKPPSENHQPADDSHPRKLGQKFVSIGIYTKKALDFFTSTAPGPEERRVHFDLLRFMEHQKTVFFLRTAHRTLSVDTPKDYEKVVSILQQAETI